MSICTLAAFIVSWNRDLTHEELLKVSSYLIDGSTAPKESLQIVATTNTNTATTNAGNTPTHFSWRLTPTNFKETKCTDFTSSCKSTNTAFTSDTCNDNGLQVLIPRSKAHLVSLIDRFGSSYFQSALLGVYKPRSVEPYTFAAFNSKTMPETGYKALDGGSFWYRDSKYTEPKGNYDKHCWLSCADSCVSNLDDIRFDETSCMAPNFLVSSTRRNYAQSKSYCESIGMKIASIHSQQENDKVKGLIKSTSYVGATEIGSSGKFTWDDGSVFDYTNPQNDGLYSKKESRIAFHTDGKWHDWGTGAHALGVVCRSEKTSSSKYICSDNNQKHTELFLTPPTGTVVIPSIQQSLKGSIVIAASSERVAQAIASTSIAYSLVVKACNAANECSEEFTTTKTCLAPRTFKDHNGLCRGCPVGFITVTNDASTCIELCVPGKYLNNGVCQTMTTSTCIAGHGFASASAQPLGSTFPLKGATADDGVCTLCLPGFFKQGAGAAGCEPCVLGKYAGPGSGALECLECTAGKYNEVATGGISACKNCIAGSSVSATGTTTPDECVGCYSGQHSAAGADVCIKCPAGKNLKDKSRKPDLHDDIADCENCAAFTYNPFPGLGSECFPCLSMKTPGGTTCSGCDPGKWKNDVADTCDACVAGKYSNDRDVSSCTDCPKGYHALAARPYIQCKSCTRGTYGFTTAAIDDTSCNKCSAGRFSEDFGLKIDVLVDGNGDALSAATIALTACKSCPKGRWSATIGGEKESLCINCGPGTHGSTTGGADNENSCLLCGKGKFSETVGSFGESDTCVSCPTGYSIGELGLTYW